MIDSKVYSEVYEILSHMDKSIVMKIPIEILETIKRRRNINYITNVDITDICNRNNVSKKTIQYIAWLDVNYWEDEKEKARLKKMYHERILKREKELCQKYNSKNIFKNN